jgi:hypothetical protein
MSWRSQCRRREALRADGADVGGTIAGAAPPALARASALARRHDRLKQRNHGLQARQLISVNQDMGIDEFDASRCRFEASTP